MFLFVRIDSFDLICAPYFNFSSMPSHIVGMLTVLTERIRECSSYTALSQRSSILLFKHVLLFSELFEPVVFQGLGSCDSVIRVIDQQLHYQVLHIWACVWDQLYYACTIDIWEVELHVCCILLEVVQKCLVRRPKDIVDFMNLVNFIIPRK